MSSLQNKLNKYEVTPPSSAWDNIAAALDETAASAEYSSKLYNMEVAPPAAAWDGISANLPVSNVVPLRKRSNSFYRYVAAALFIGVLAFGAIKLMTGNTTHTAGDATATLNTSKDTPTAKTNTPSSSQTDIQTDDTNITPSTPEKNTEIAQLEQSSKNHLRKTMMAADVSNAAFTANDETADDIYNNPIYAYEDRSSNLADRYIMLMTPDGKFIRMSKKWGNLVCSVSGEEQDADCKDQLKKWQEKIACDPMTGSSGNFLDVLSLVSSLDDSQGL